MNRSQVEGLIRAVMLGLGGVLVTLGVQVATGPGWEALTGLAVSAAGTVWSWYSNKTSTMISRVANEDEVHAVVTTPEISHSDPNPKVTDPKSIQDAARAAGISTAGMMD